MDQPSPFERMLCKVQAIIGLDVCGYDFYEVFIEATGEGATLLCEKISPLTVGEEFLAEYCGVSPDGKYLLQNPVHEMDEDGNWVIMPIFDHPSIPGGGKLLQFRKPVND